MTDRQDTGTALRVRRATHEDSVARDDPHVHRAVPGPILEQG